MYSNSSSSEAMLESLKQKQREISSEVETLQSKLTSIENKKKVSSKICETLSKSSQALKGLIKLSSSPQQFNQKIFEISELIQSQERLIEKHLNFNIESMAIQKLIQLFKLQVSINTFTEEHYLEKTKRLTEDSKRERSSPDKLNKSIHKEKANELAHSLHLIQIQNTQFMSAIKKNLEQLSLLIEPTIEKTLNLFVVLQQKPNHKTSEEFGLEQLELEENFRDINKYIRHFSELFQEINESCKEFDTFSDITNNENSFHRLEVEELEIRHQFSTDRNRFSKDSFTELKIIDEIVKFVDFDAENQKSFLKMLLKIMDSLDHEKKKWESQSKSKFKPNPSDQIKLIYLIIDEFFQLLKETIKTKDESISKLENIREQALDFKRTPKVDTSLYLSDTRKSYVFTDPSRFNTQLRYEDKSTPKPFDTGSPILENLRDDLENSVSFSSEKNIEDFEKLVSELESAQTQIRTYQETIAYLQKKQDQNKGKFENFNFRLKSLTQIEVKALYGSLAEIKLSASKNIQDFSVYFRQKMIQLSKDLLDRNYCSLSSLKIERDEVKYLNDTLEKEKEALKDSFQTDIKKFISEQQDLKKINKDLSDSLLKLSKKYESLNKTLSEIWNISGISSADNISAFKQMWTRQQQFLGKVKVFFGEQSLENIEKKLKNRDENVYRKIEEALQAHEKNLGKMMNVFKNFIDKYQLKIEKSSQILVIFKKFYENGLHEIDTHSAAGQDLVKIEELERNLIKYKHSERELQCIISSKSLELSESIEKFSNLQEFTKDCIRLIEAFSVAADINRVKELQPAIQEILELHERYYNN